MDLKKLIAVGALLIAPKSFTNTIQEETKEQIQLTLSQQGKHQDKENPVYFTFEASQELLSQIDTMDIGKKLPIMFCRSWEDVRNTPLVMKGTRRHMGEFLGYDQYDYILKKYNNDTIPDSLKTSDDLMISKIDHINFPLIYDEIGTAVPHTITGLLEDERFAAYRDTIKINESLVVVMKQSNERFSLLYYENNKLIIGTYATIGGKGNPTPRGLFQIDYNVKDKRSNEYNNAAMPYALHVIKGIFIHQGKVSHQVNSHGCIRIPGLYAEALYYFTTTPKIDMVYKAEHNMLDSIQTQKYDSLKREAPKLIIVD